jgi:L-fucose isomerase-like protein
MAAGYYLAIKEMVKERGYEAISLKDVDGMKRLLGFPPAPIFMLLADCDGICTIPENDSLGNVTQLMVKYATGQCGAYLEFYEFMEDRVLAGVPDYVPAEIIDGDITVMPAAFGELSEGILNVSKVKPGELTLCRLTNIGDKYYMHMVKGQGITPRKWEEAGWTQPAPQLPGLEILMDNVEHFAENVMCQHYIISYGDNTEVIKNLCSILGIEVIQS